MSRIQILYQVYNTSLSISLVEILQPIPPIFHESKTDDSHSVGKFASLCIYRNADTPTFQTQHVQIPQLLTEGLVLEIPGKQTTAPKNRANYVFPSPQNWLTFVL